MHTCTDLKTDEGLTFAYLTNISIYFAFWFSLIRPCGAPSPRGRHLFVKQEFDGFGKMNALCLRYFVVILLAELAWGNAKLFFEGLGEIKLITKA